MIRSLQLLRDCTDRAQRTTFLACTAFLVVLACVVLHLSDKPDDASIALFLVGLGGWVLWACWFSRVLLVVVQARALAMPLPWRDVTLAWLCAFAATVVLPAACFIAAGIPFNHSLLALTLAAVAGLAFMFLPGWCAILIGLLPMLNDLLDGADVDLVTDANLFAWLLLLLLVAAWRGHVVVRDGARLASTAASRPLVLALAQACYRQGGLFGLRDSSRHFAETPAWLMDIGSTGRHGPQSPVSAMRAWLGSPFAPMRGRYRARQLAVAIGALVLFPLLTAGDSEQAFRLSSLTWAAGFGGLMLATVFPARLASLANRPSGELAELALLPGFGSPERARGTLLRAIALPAAVAFGGLLVLVVGLGVYAGLGATGILLLVVAIVGFAIASALGCLRPIAGRPLGWAWGVVGLIASIPLLVVTGFAAAGDPADGASGLLPWAAFAWAAVYAFLGQRLHAAWGWLAERPHAFLQR